MFEAGASSSEVAIEDAGGGQSEADVGIEGIELLAFKEEFTFVDGSFEVTEEGEFLGGSRAAFEQELEVWAGLLAAGSGSKEESDSRVRGEVGGVLLEDKLEVLDRFAELADVDVDVGESGGGADVFRGETVWDAAIVFGSLRKSIES